MTWIQRHAWQGGVASRRDGLTGAPIRWREGLRGHDVYQLPLDELLKRG